MNNYFIEPMPQAQRSKLISQSTKAGAVEGTKVLAVQALSQQNTHCQGTKHAQSASNQGSA